MGEVTLNINANVQGALKGTEQLNKSVDELNKDTEQYNKRATTGFNQTGQAANQASQGVNNMATSASKAMTIFKGLALSMGAAFSIGMIVQWGKAVAASTGAGQDAMERFKLGMERAGQALNTAISNADFSGLIQSLRDAYTEGKRYADVLDEIQARQVALGAFKATLETQQAEQKLIARNAQNSIEVRQAAIDKIIELEKQKLTETLSLQNTELDEALRAAAVRTGINIKDEEQLKARAALVREWAMAYGTVEGVNSLNAQLEKANDLQAGLDALVTQTQLKSGGYITDYSKRDAAVSKLTESEKRLLALRNINNTITDEERDNINKAMETALQRLRNTLLNELLGEKEKEAKADKERVKTTTEENLATLEKYVEEANKLTYDINLGTGGEQSAEQFQKQIDENIKGLELEMNLNPQFSTDDSAEAKAWDDAQKLVADNLAELEKQQKDAFDAMQKFAEDHPLAEAMGFDSEEQLEQMKDYASQILDFVNEMVDQEVEQRQRLVDDWNQKIDEQQELVNRENEDKAAGLANNYALEQENLVKMQKARDQSVKDREKAIKLQRTMSTIESGIALVSATANIIKGFSTIPVVGVILGLLAVGAMIAGFVASTAKVKDATQMGEGGQAHGLLKGKRHSQGGIPINAEEGEWFINRNSSAKYSPLLDAINRDDQKGMKLFFDRKFLTKMPQQKLSFDIDSSKRLSEIARNTRKSNSETFYGPGYIIERVGGYTKKINLN
jgi:hypothetical protein